MPRHKTPDVKDDIRHRWAARHCDRLPPADFQQVADSLLRVLRDAPELGLDQSSGCVEVDEPLRKMWPTCGGVPESRLPNLVYQDLKARGLRVPWGRSSRESTKLTDRGGGCDLERLLLRLVQTGEVERIADDTAVYWDWEDKDKRYKGEAAWRLREAKRPRETPTLEAPPVEHRSRPMSKAELARRIADDERARPRKVQVILHRHGLRNESGNLWTIALDKLDAGARKRVEAP